MNWKEKFDALNIHPTPGENGWPEKMHVPNVRGLMRGTWVNECGTRGCLVGHCGAAFLNGPYVDYMSWESRLWDTTNRGPRPAIIDNFTLEDSSAAVDFLRLMIVRLGGHGYMSFRRSGIVSTASTLFENASLPFEEVVEAWLDVTEYCGYVVTPAFRKRMLKEA